MYSIGEEMSIHKSTMAYQFKHLLEWEVNGEETHARNLEVSGPFSRSIVQDSPNLIE